MDTPRLRSPRPPQQPSRPTLLPPLPPPPPPLSAATSPSYGHDDFSFPSPFGDHLPPLSMSRTPVGRVGSDLSHLNHSRITSHHHHATTSSRDRDRAKSKASPFFSGLGTVWRKDNTTSSRASDAAAGKPPQAEDKRKDKARRALEVGQWVKRHMASMVEQLRASFSRQGERREQQRRRPHSFSGHGRPSAAAREMKEWRRRRGQMASAPASLRVSPANSGHLSVGGSVKVSTSSEESTMEELHSAIEAAIAHCKNSISVAKHAEAGEDNASFSKP